MAESGHKIICVNRRARFDYTISETIEAGLVLQGTEVKSLRDGKADLRDAYADIQEGEIFLLHAHIHEYEQGNRFNHDPVRPRKLLLHKREIERLLGKTQEKGLTLIPTRMYFSHGKAKVELGLAIRPEDGDWLPGAGRFVAARRVCGAHASRISFG